MEEKMVNNVLGHVKYHFIDSNGPKYEYVTDEQSITVRWVFVK